MTLEDFAGRINNAKPKQILVGGSRFQGFAGCCPAHEDKSPSFAVWQGDDGWLHFRCKAGCNEDQILRALYITRDDCRVMAYAGHISGKRETIYQYTDEKGEYLFEKVRTVDDNGKKKFFQRIALGDGSFENGLASLNGHSKELYRLVELIAGIQSGKTIYICEGEKAVERFRSLGYIATCQPGGATKDRPESKWLPEHTKRFKGAKVVIVADRDEVGEVYAAFVAKQLTGVAQSVRVVQSATEREHDDAFDHFEAKFTTDQFVNRSDLMPRRGLKIRIPPPTSGYVEPEYLLFPYLPRGKCILIDGNGGIGKSSLVLAWAASLSRGIHPLTREILESGPVKTLYLHKGEDTDEELNTVYMANGGVNGMILFAGEGIVFDREGLREVQETIEDYGCGLVIVDAFFYFVQGIVKDSNAALDVLKVMEILNQVATDTKATFWDLRHTRKGSKGEEVSEMGMGSVQFRNSHRGQMVLRPHPTNFGAVVVTCEKGSLLVPKAPHFVYKRVELEIQYLTNCPNPFEDPDRFIEPKGKMELAKAIIKEMCEGQYVRSSDVWNRCESAGVSVRTYRAARAELGVQTGKYGGVDSGNWTHIPVNSDPFEGM